MDTCRGAFCAAAAMTTAATVATIVDNHVLRIRIFRILCCSPARRIEESASVGIGVASASDDATMD